MTRGMVLTVIALGLVLGNSRGGAPAAWGQEPSVEERLELLEQQIVRQRPQRLYRRACAPCHGVRGDGQGPGARALNPKPRDFTQAWWKFRTTPSGVMPTDADLFRTISEGVPGTTMPAWKRLLSVRQRWAQVQYIKTFAAESFAAAAEEPEEPLRLPPAPPATPASIARGKQLYEEAECWGCHGYSGRGDGPSAATLEDDRGRPIRPWDLTKGVYKSGQQPGDLLRTVLTGLAGTPMPSFDVLTVEEGWDLVHYVRSLARPKNLWYYLFLDTGEFFPGR